MVRAQGRACPWRGWKAGYAPRARLTQAARGEGIAGLPGEGHSGDEDRAAQGPRVAFQAAGPGGIPDVGVGAGDERDAAQHDGDGQCEALRDPRRSAGTAWPARPPRPAAPGPGWWPSGWMPPQCRPARSARSAPRSVRPAATTGTARSPPAPAAPAGPPGTAAPAPAPLSRNTAHISASTPAATAQSAIRNDAMPQPRTSRNFSHSGDRCTSEVPGT